MHTSHNIIIVLKHTLIHYSDCIFNCTHCSPPHSSPPFVMLFNLSMHIWGDKLRGCYYYLYIIRCGQCQYENWGKNEEKLRFAIKYVILQIISIRFYCPLKLLPLSNPFVSCCGEGDRAHISTQPLIFTNTKRGW